MMFCFFKQKTAYDMRISDWSSDVCSSDLAFLPRARSTSRQASLGDRCRSGRPDQLPQAGPARPDGRTRWSCQNRPFAMPEPVHAWKLDRKSVVSGKGVAGRLDHGGSRLDKKKVTEEL